MQRACHAVETLISSCAPAIHGHRFALSCALCARLADGAGVAHLSFANGSECGPLTSRICRCVDNPCAEGPIDSSVDIWSTAPEALLDHRRRARSAELASCEGARDSRDTDGAARDGRSFVAARACVGDLGGGDCEQRDPYRPTATLCDERTALSVA